MIRIALTKGRIEKSALEILKTCGYDVGELEAKGRKLIFRTGNLEIVLAKAADVITYIDRGVCDVGFVGSDTINEHGGNFRMLHNIYSGGRPLYFAFVFRLNVKFGVFLNF